MIPADGTVERWAYDYVVSTRLAHKLAPPPAPEVFAGGPPIRLASPGRPPELRVVPRAPKAPKAGALRRPEKRAALFSTFLHHELQAAELFAWALLAFPDTPIPFRRGLLKILGDELRHMELYRAHVERLGGEIGREPVRDWFWERVPRATTPASFVALLGLGLEGANLDHAARWAERLREAGDEEAARIEETVGEEEIPHVRFALHWFERFTGETGFDAFRAALPPPVSPAVLRGEPMARAARRRAGLDDAFLDALAACRLDPSSS